MTVDTFTASTTWTCPAGVTSVDAECWAGGAGGWDTSGGGNQCGGGGGAYSKKLAIAVTPGNSYTVTVAGSVAIKTNGNDSWFSTSGTVLAKGGLASATSSAQGGQASSGIGDTKFSGGNGAIAGGGGGAGDANNGGNGSGGGGGTGGVSGGGNGGNANTNGATLGGGGGGGGSPGTGARGQVVLTYTAAATQTHQMII